MKYYLKAHMRTIVGDFYIHKSDICLIKTSYKQEPLYKLSVIRQIYRNCTIHNFDFINIKGILD